MHPVRCIAGVSGRACSVFVALESIVEVVLDCCGLFAGSSLPRHQAAEAAICANSFWISPRFHRSWGTGPHASAWLYLVVNDVDDCRSSLSFRWLTVHSGSCSGLLGLRRSLYSLSRLLRQPFGGDHVPSCIIGLPAQEGGAC